MSNKRMANTPVLTENHLCDNSREQHHRLLVDHRHGNIFERSPMDIL